MSATTTLGALKRALYLPLLGYLLAFGGIQRAAAQASPGVNHFALYVYDLQKSADFYQRVLGLTQIPEPFHDGRHIWLRMGPHSQLHLIQGAAKVESHDKNTHLAFSVKDFPAFLAHLDKTGTPYGSWQGEAKQTTPRPDGVKQVYLQDPDNFWVEVNDDRF